MAGVDAANMAEVNVANMAGVGVANMAEVNVANMAGVGVAKMTEFKWLTWLMLMWQT